MDRKRVRERERWTERERDGEMERKSARARERNREISVPVSVNNRWVFCPPYPPSLSLYDLACWGEGLEEGAAVETRAVGGAPERVKDTVCLG